MFDDSDSFIAHLSGAVKAAEDDFVASRYIGFIAVSAVTVYEIMVKKLLIDFAVRKHPMLGNFASASFDRLNAKIQREDIEKYLAYFGDEYLNFFKKTVDEKEKARAQEGSLKACYANLLEWRHEFVHAGRLPNQATFDEAIKAYHLGKEVVAALEETLSQTPDTPADRRQVDGKA
ncbi:MAG: HEPN domain-containing protein [Planctomycetota bacterium]